MATPPGLLRDYSEITPGLIRVKAHSRILPRHIFSLESGVNSLSIVVGGYFPDVVNLAASVGQTAVLVESIKGSIKE